MPSFPEIERVRRIIKSNADLDCMSVGEYLSTRTNAAMQTSPENFRNGGSCILLEVTDKRQVIVHALIPDNNSVSTLVKQIKSKRTVDQDSTFLTIEEVDTSDIEPLDKTKEERDVESTEEKITDGNSHDIFLTSPINPGYSFLSSVKWNEP
jgi:hypothetical protein